MGYHTVGVLSSAKDGTLSPNACSALGTSARLVLLLKVAVCPMLGAAFMHVNALYVSSTHASLTGHAHACFRPTPTS